MKRFLLLLLFFCSSAFAQFSSVEFGAAQIADTQWDTGNCLSSNTCTIYSKNLGGTYETGSWIPLSSGQYVSFVSSGNSTYPWQMNLYNSNGSLNRVLGIGQIIVQGTYNGNYYMFFTNANYNGTLLSAQVGMTGSSGFTFTGTENPTVAQTNAAAASWTNTPLTGGQTYTPAPTYVSGITGTQQTQVNTVNARLAALTNSTPNQIYINQVGSGDIHNYTQSGPGNIIDGATYINSTPGYTQVASITGGSNQVKIRQGDPQSKSGKNIIDLNVTGSGNILNLNQGTDSAGTYTGLDTGGHYQYDYINGATNSVTVVQENTGANEGMYSSLYLNGNLNTVGITQTGTAKMQLFASVTGNSNTLTTSQTGTGAHYLSVTETGNGNSAVVTQNNSSAPGANAATIVLNNNGAPASVNVTQTGGQTYNITQTCVTTCGTVTVHQ